jgi:CheY-like chemotaxis protein
VEVESGFEAIDIMCEGKSAGTGTPRTDAAFDMILMDIDMPGMNGW